MDETKTFGEAAGKVLIDAAALSERATKRSTTSDDVHRRHFVRTFRRWAILFKRKGGDIEADKWLIAEYYDSLGHLSEAGLDALTKVLKETCVFFPTISECLEATRCGPYDWGHPFLSLKSGGSSVLLRDSWTRRLTPPAEQIEYDD